MVVTATLLVTFGRISDMFGRVKLYNLGFAVFTAGSILLFLTPGSGDTAALELIIFRLIQGIGGGFLFANSTAILTDAFPANQRGLAMGINQIAAILGSIAGLILGGVLAAINWRLVFLVSVPFGLFGTAWAYLMLREIATIRAHQRIDWAGIYMLPLMVGFIVMGPLSGWLSDRYGARLFSTLGMLIQAAAFLGLTFLPANFDYTPFALLLLVLGIGQGMFAAPNTTAIMNSVPPEYRGVASGMRSTFQNTGMVASIGVFFSIVTVGLAVALPGAFFSGLTQAGVPAPVASAIAHLPPTAALFAAFLGYNPMATLLPGPVRHHLPAASQAHLLGKSFFPNLISAPFMTGLHAVFYLSLVMCVIAAVASLLRGQRYIYDQVAAGAVAAGSSKAATTLQGRAPGPM